VFGKGGYSDFGELRVTADGLEMRIIDPDGRARFETTLTPER
jgi:hypothetical protein